MRFVNAKAADIEKALPGVKVDVEFQNSSITAVTLTGTNGDVVKLAMNSYSFVALITEKPKTEKKFEVAGTVCNGNGTFKAVVNTEEEAKEVVERIESGDQFNSHRGDKLEVKPVEVDVPF